MTSSDTYDEICRFLQPYNKKDIPLTPETELAADLEIDSADAMNLIMQIEDRFEIDIPLNLLGDVQNLRQLLALVQARIQSR
jgi:acyl carrier protein